MKKTIFLLLALPMLFVACGGSDDNTNDVQDSDIQTEASALEVAEITIEGDDNMKFNLSEITVKAGQTVKLTLVHTGEMSESAMGHNFVLLNQGVDMAEFAMEAIDAKDNDYIPASREGDVIAHTT